MGWPSRTRRTWSASAGRRPGSGCVGSRPGARRASRTGPRDRATPHARCPRCRWTRASPPDMRTGSVPTGSLRSSAFRARRSATCSPAPDSPASATRTARPASRSAPSPSARDVLPPPAPPASARAVLPRHGLSRLRDQDRPPGAPIRYVRERPGELLHIDVKKLGRIPDGGGHRFRGRVTGTPRSHAGYDYLHVAIDDMSRVAFVAPYRDERGTTCARFLLNAAAFFAGHGVRIERVLTDNARNYTTSRAFAAALAEIGARHKRTRPFRPQTNGKAERFNGTLLTEWAYARLYVTNQPRLDAFPAWLDFYNSERPHGSLGGQ